MELFIQACQRQYQQAFTMLRRAIELCPDELWADSEEREPAFWRQVFHVLVITLGYGSQGCHHRTDRVDKTLALVDQTLQPRPARPGEQPWRPRVEAVDRLMDAMHVPAGMVTRDTMLEFLDTAHRQCLEALERDVKLPPDAIEANPFQWTGPTTFDKHLYNLRHLQHHLGRVNGLLRRRADISNPWVSETQPNRGLTEDVPSEDVPDEEVPAEDVSEVSVGR